MDLDFERGQATAPVGHALVYFSDSQSNAILATYIVVLPIVLQLAKYVPPMLAAQLPLGEMKGVGAVPLPPLPEPVEGHAFLTRLASLRQDDLIAGGSLRSGDIQRSMLLVTEIAQSYARLYERSLERQPAAEPEPAVEEAVSDLSASDMIYQLMSEQQKLAELAKLASQLRYAVDGGDRRQIGESVAELERLARHLPATYDLPTFIGAAQQPGDRGRQLSTLYLDRCYKLASEDYRAVEQLDQEIARLNAQ
jgi:hypothetical protein